MNKQDILNYISQKFQKAQQTDNFTIEKKGEWIAVTVDSVNG